MLSPVASIDAPDTHAHGGARAQAQVFTGVIQVLLLEADDGDALCPRYLQRGSMVLFGHIRELS